MVLHFKKQPVKCRVGLVLLATFGFMHEASFDFVSGEGFGTILVMQGGRRLAYKKFFFLEKIA